MGSPTMLHTLVPVTLEEMNPAEFVLPLIRVVYFLAPRKTAGYKHALHK